MPNLGYSFAPNFENADMGRRGGDPRAAPQGALQTINYQLPPRVAGAPGGLSPLQGQDQAGPSHNSSVLASVLRTVLGAGADDVLAMGDQGAQAYLQAIMGQPAPQRGAPVVHPGGDGSRAPVDEGTARVSVPGLQTPDGTAFADRSRPGTAGDPPFLQTSPAGQFMQNERGMGAFKDPGGGYLSSVLMGQGWPS